MIDYQQLSQILNATKNDKELFYQIVNAPFKYQVEMAFLFLGIIAFLLIDEKTGIIQRLALSETDLADDVAKVSKLPFKDIVIKITDSENLIVKAIKSGKCQGTSDWQELLRPAFSPEQARINQAGGGIAYTAVYPLQARNKGALTFNYFQYENEIGEQQNNFMERYAAIVDEALSRKLS